MTHGSDDVPRVRVAVGAVALAVAMSACGGPPATPTGVPPGHRPTPTRPAARPPTPTTTRTATPTATPTATRPTRHARGHPRAALARLVVRPRPRGTRGYLRDDFGTAWLDTDHNGCNQRDDVLLRDAVPGTTRVARQGACDHDVLAGTWHDPYTGRTLRFTDLKDLRQAEAIQIDHVVPLAEAWVSGADRWTAARREAFANDLHELLAVDGPTNASKGDGDPAAWRPRQGYQCSYASRWISVKARWHLAVDPPEVAALRDMLSYCR